ncbi:hypothetical protein E2F43_12035 [Seongchinamella unica]|uniref:Uncharacterized protein n=1 Tax=Seongchinamella unica TaxID=2547392 RepID=A0A4R5LTB9_9GAMM|nr:hypothetical protein [Seongchinamella unica]TDG14195.1 hypothetical protein E2F43_12035 [Seongchinamella unica]
MKPVKTITSVLLMGALLIALPGCMKQEGPAEKVGKSLDETAESVGDHVEDAGEAVQDAASGDNR